jgi:hypothetical protein
VIVQLSLTAGKLLKKWVAFTHMVPNKHIEFAPIFWAHEALFAAGAADPFGAAAPAGNNSDLIGWPAHVVKYRGRISVVVPALRERLDRQPTLAEIAAEIGISERMVRLSLATAQSIWSLSKRLSASTGLLLGDMVAAADVSEDATDTTAISEALLVSVRVALSTLTSLQRQVIDLTFGFQDQQPKGFRAVSECLGCHDKRVSWNVYHQAIDQLGRQLLSPADYAAPTSSSTAIAARQNTAVLSRLKTNREKATLSIRKNHYEALGRPSRVRVQAEADGLQIVPDPKGRYQVVERAGHIYIAINSIARRQRMRAGRYAAQVVDGACISVPIWADWVRDE